jgi:hypothetical protein
MTVESGNDGWMWMAGMGFAAKWHYVSGSRVLCGTFQPPEYPVLQKELAGGQVACGNCAAALERRKRFLANADVWKANGKY